MSGKLRGRPLFAISDKSRQITRSDTLSGVLILPANQNAPEITVPAPLAKKIKRSGMVYREFWRSDNVAIYCANGAGPRIEYEVFRVQLLPAQEINGNSYPARESLPPSSEWGESGWTFTNNSHRDPLAVALVKAQQIARRAAAKEKANDE